MFYSLLRWFVRLGLKWYAPGLTVKHLQLAPYSYPAIVIANHPNSFFDALVIAAFAPVKICFLARGDAFKHPVANIVLRGLYMLPVYKRRDDEESGIKNDFTFDECIRRLVAGQHILLFPEGKSRNIWELQPFMNGGLTSLLERSYKAGLPVQIQAYTLNYNSFQHVPKAIELRTLSPLDTTDYIAGHQMRTGDVIQDVRNDLLETMVMTPLVAKPRSSKEIYWWRFPAKIGYYTQFWFYRLWRNYVKKKTAGTIFYDSLLFVALLFSYPLLVLFCSILVGKLLGFGAGVFLFIFLPGTAYAMARYQGAVTETETNIPKRNSWNNQGEAGEKVQ